MGFSVFNNRNVKFYLIQHAIQPYFVLSFIFPAYLFLLTKNIILIGILLSIAYILGHFTVIYGFLTDYIVNTRIYDFTLSILSSSILITSFFINSNSTTFIFTIYTVLGIVHSFKGTNHRKVLRHITNSYKDFRNIWVITHSIRAFISIALIYISLFILGLKYIFLILGLYMLLVHTPLIFLIDYPKGTGNAKLIFNLTLSLFKGNKSAQFYIIDNFFSNFFSGLVPVFIGAFALSSSFLVNYMIYYTSSILYDAIYLIILNREIKTINNTKFAFLYFRGLIPSLILVAVVFLPPSLYVIPSVLLSVLGTLYSLFVYQKIQFNIPKEIYATFIGLDATFGSLFNTLGNLILPYIDIVLGVKFLMILASIMLLTYSLAILYLFNGMFKALDK